MADTLDDAGQSERPKFGNRHESGWERAAEIGLFIDEKGSLRRAVYHQVSRLKHGQEISLFEVLPVEEDRLADDLGEHVGEAVAEIHHGSVAALAKVEESLKRARCACSRRKDR